MFSGTVRWFNLQAGFGYIQQHSGNTDVFVYLRDVMASGLSDLHEGQILTFDTAAASGGQQHAVNIKVA